MPTRCPLCDQERPAAGLLHLVPDVALELGAQYTPELCIGCAETTLQRRLVPADFANTPANTWPTMSQHERADHPLISRLPLLDRNVAALWDPVLLDRLGVLHRYQTPVE